MIRKNSLILVLTVIFIGGLIGCGGTDYSEPRGVVIQMFGAMERDDKAALAHILDLPEIMKSLNEDYALKTNNPRSFVNPQEILEDLTEEGLTKQRWFSYQRIVNTAQVMGETATVEVTFVDKDNSKGYRTKFGLHLVNGKWKIFSFKTESDPNS